MMKYNKQSFEFLDKIPTLNNASAFIFWEDDISPINSIFFPLSIYAEMRPYVKFNTKSYYPSEGLKLQGTILKKQESVLWVSDKKNTIFFIGNKPIFKHSEFIDTLIDILIMSGVTNIYTVSCISAQTSHRQKRAPLIIFNSEELKTEFSQKYKSIKYKPFSITPNMKTEIPEFNFYISWKCAEKKIPSINLMIETPFYMSLIGDVSASITAGKIICKILKWRFQFKKNLTEIAEEQNELMEFLVKNSEDAMDFIERIEANELLSIEEMQLLLSEFKRVMEEKRP